MRTPRLTQLALCLGALGSALVAAAPAETQPAAKTQPATETTQAVKPVRLSNPASLDNWPAEANPVHVGRRIAENFLPRDLLRKRLNGHIVYPEACAWYGALTWAELAGDAGVQQALWARWEKVLAKDSPAVISPVAHVDDRAFGIVPLEIYRQNKDQRAYFVGTALAELQWKAPDAQGLSAESRFWIDDMYMVPALQVQAWRVTKDAKFLDRAALTATAYLERLQQKNGLFLHAADSPFYWGRGNGWFAAGLAELLTELPVEHPRRPAVLAGYLRMMEALLATQDAESGLWRQLIDQPDSWVETSGSAMFTFAFVTGVKRGWLPEQSYGPAARKAWLALVSRLDAGANLTEICVGTNKAMKEVGADLAVQRDFYMKRARKAGDLHGQAPMLWTASALLR